MLLPHIPGVESLQNMRETEILLVWWFYDVIGETKKSMDVILSNQIAPVSLTTTIQLEQRFHFSRCHTNSLSLP